MFNFTAENPDELNMIDQEELELIGEGVDEGWVKAKKYEGNVGYVPRTFFHPLESIPEGVTINFRDPNHFEPETEEPYQIL